MPNHHAQKPTLRLSRNGTEPLEIHLESTNPVTVQLQLDSPCTCQHPTQNRPGSYIDSDPGTH
ncbi:hypothetical protein NFC73_08590 [Pseudarthrobacter sp. RMG13]|uniref:Uncharacterized protein n=1 Tax=Pseudarthrobacter humi TaxID=2952523 RepID=A0ABT1LMX3_9MICC|nr:hypothetical protein [Pseudarthrobacter humi]MCP8999787.1 hypothetical protein [Pseudarthrobacter humi]